MSCFCNITFHQLSRLLVQTTPVYALGCRHFSTSQCLRREPLRKSRVDPNLAIEKERKQLKKIEKEMEKMKRRGSVLKPIEEMEYDFTLRKEKEKRKRVSPEFSEEEQEQQILLNKAWNRFKMIEHLKELMNLQRTQRSQQRALAELRAVSEDLYQQAIQCDDDLLPHSFSGPYLTPPIENYAYPDGDYIDITKEY